MRARLIHHLNRSLTCCLLFIGPVIPMSAAPAREGNSQTNASITAVAAPPVTAGRNQYVLGAGDEISLNVVDMPEVSAKQLRIGPNGDVDLPLIGSINASGLTIEQLKSSLASKLAKYITDPEISINLVENQSRTVSVLGEVNSPGVRELSGPRNLVQIISLSGGVKTDAGPRVIITREADRGSLPVIGLAHTQTATFSTVTLSLDDLLASKTPSDNFLMEPGDVVSIPKEQVVYVIGDVHRSGGFPLSSHETISLLQALSLAEGLGPDAATGRAKILRPTPGSNTPKEIPIDVKAIISGKSPDLPMYANDILFIPNSGAKSGTRRAAEAVLQVATGVAIFR